MSPRPLLPSLETQLAEAVRGTVVSAAQGAEVRFEDRVLPRDDHEHVHIRGHRRSSGGCARGQVMRSLKSIAKS